MIVCIDTIERLSRSRCHQKEFLSVSQQVLRATEAAFCSRHGSAALGVRGAVVAALADDDSSPNQTLQARHTQKHRLSQATRFDDDAHVMSVTI